ncbi:MAG: cupin domain-containing protein [Chloroflexi bacterium]|nr:cupin domain-containing protein [Chloroflexota bacterium]
MSRQIRPAHVSSSELELLDIEVTRAGGGVRYLEGERHGLRTSAYHSQVPPGAGPPPHRHPYAEYFVLHDGQGTYLVDDESFAAVAGDVVIVPPNAWHSFTSTGDGPLRQTAVHEAPRHAMERRSEVEG